MKLLAILAKKAPKASSSEEAPSSSPDLEAEGDDAAKGYRDELASLLGVKDEDRDAFGEALRGFVCATHDDESEEDEEEV